MNKIRFLATHPSFTLPSLSFMSMATLAACVFFSALGVIYNKHLSRQLFANLQTLQQEIEALQVEWSQLLLEQGTWASDARVDRVAKEHLHMVLPEPHEVVVIKEQIK